MLTFFLSALVQKIQIDGTDNIKNQWTTDVVCRNKDKDNNLLGLSASLLAGERASKDTSPLGPYEVAADPSML